ncbi:hypothetical protein ACFWY9_29675 [Amycolatopsis sp. NPDC059027]|uniref:hypothetical protein n=1 Tax=Amycolatopsis sp. NPDC059027 TaxID=3346709 RepID=UPI003672A189
MFGKSTQDGSTPKPSRRVRNLTVQLDEARDVHRLAADPLLGAVTADRFRVSVARTMWVFLAVGLGFTTTGVHDFLAGDRPIADPLWWGAWLAEPALAGILVTLLRWEASMLSQGIGTGDKPVVYLKRLLLAATLVANVWAGLAPAHGGISKGMVFFHVVIPLVVFLLAEVMPIIQRGCTQAREKAIATGQQNALTSGNAHAGTGGPGTVHNGPERPATPAPATSIPRLKLPAEIAARIESAVTAARTEGRQVTTEDIRRVARIPDALAAQVVRQLTEHNGHPITT